MNLRYNKSQPKRRIFVQTKNVCCWMERVLHSLGVIEALLFIVQLQSSFISSVSEILQYLMTSKISFPGDHVQQLLESFMQYSNYIISLTRVLLAIVLQFYCTIFVELSVDTNKNSNFSGKMAFSSI